MKITFGGIRGTGPVTGGAFMEFGGDTTSLLIEGSGKARVVIDMGTGIRMVDYRIRRTRGARSLFILLTHYHLDHLMGIPSFSQLYDPAWSLKILGPRLNGFAIEEVMHRVLAKPFWPLQMDAMRASTRFADLGDPGFEQPFAAGSMIIRWCPVHHPGGCVAYRVDEPATGASLVFATDIEWGVSTVAEKEAFIAFCRDPKPAQVLLFDGQYPPGSYEKYRTWGHSTWQDGVEVARHAGIPRLLVIHHWPSLDDAALRRNETDLRQAMPRARLARQGQSFTIGSRSHPAPA